MYVSPKGHPLTAEMVEQRHEQSARHFMFPTPKILATNMADVRNSRKTMGIVSFSCWDQDCIIDAVFSAGCLGIADDDWMDEGLTLEAPVAPGAPVTFRSSEAAFLATQHWPLAEQFASVSTDEARDLAHSLGHKDATYAGFGSAWASMLAVQNAKFKDPFFAAALLCTQDSLLIASDDDGPRAAYARASLGSEQSQVDVARGWCVGPDGSGLNLLGVQLMLVRQRLSKKWRWGWFVQDFLDLNTGECRRAERVKVWTDSLRRAWSAVDAARETHEAQTAKTAQISLAASRISDVRAMIHQNMHQIRRFETTPRLVVTEEEATEGSDFGEESEPD